MLRKAHCSVSANSNDKPNTINMKMNNGQSIRFVESCIHLGSELSTSREHIVIGTAVKELNCRLNCSLISKCL